MTLKQKDYIRESLVDCVKNYATYRDGFFINYHLGMCFAVIDLNEGTRKEWESILKNVTYYFETHRKLGDLINFKRAYQDDLDELEELCLVGE